MSIELIRYQRDKNSGELYATPPNGKCPIWEDAQEGRTVSPNSTNFKISLSVHGMVRGKRQYISAPW